MDQASLLAAFPPPVANAAPATPVFANLISLMFSPQTAPPPSSLKTSASPQATAASPAQIADAMIRSMLDGPLSGTAASENSIPASTASVAIPNQALSLSNPPIAPKAAVLRDDPPPVQLPLTAGNANPPLGTTNPNPPAQAPRKQPRTAADALMAAVTPVVTMPALPAAVTPPAADPEIERVRAGHSGFDGIGRDPAGCQELRRSQNCIHGNFDACEGRSCADRPGCQPGHAKAGAGRCGEFFHYDRVSARGEARNGRERTTASGQRIPSDGGGARRERPTGGRCVAAGT